MNNNIIELIRVSTEDQANVNRAGIPRQEEVNKNTIKRCGLNRIEKIILKDISGTKISKTKEMQHIINMMKSGDISGVVVADIDRLIRPDNYDDYSLLQRFKETNTKIYTNDSVLDLNTQTGFLLGGIGSTIAGNELTQIKKRMIGGIRVKQLQGKHPSGKHTLPTGVDYNYKDEYFFYNKRSLVIKKLFEMALKRFSYTEMSRRTGIKHFTIPGLLRNELFIGYKIYLKENSNVKRNGWKRRENYQESDVNRVRVIERPLIKPEIFYKVQKIINQNREAYRMRKKSMPERFFLNGIIYCGECKQRMYIAATHRDANEYYFCRTLKSCYRGIYPRCGNGWIIKTIINKAVDAFISYISNNKSYFNSLIDKMLTKNTAFGAVNDELNQNIEKYKEMIKRKNDLIYRHKNNDIAPKYFNKTIHGIDKDIDLNTKSREVLSKQKKEIMQSVDTTMLNELTVYARDYTSMTDKDKRPFLLQYMPRIYMIGNEITGFALPKRNTSVVYNLELEKPFGPDQYKILNKYGLEKDCFYSTADICKLLNIAYSTYYYRLNKGYYPKTNRIIGKGIRYTEKDINMIMGAEKNRQKYHRTRAS